ncbi:hypothetical protein [Pollutimonas thiosulfatoxidans]|nr:hypothetical protein [Pollutimonas thiosulfatoxidans]
MRFARNNVAFILCPLVYFTIKTNFFKPYGLYEGYNQSYNLDDLYFKILWILADLKEFMLEIHWPTCITLIVFTFLITKPPRNMPHTRGTVRISAFLIGNLAIILGSFPYLIVGHVPVFKEWGSRHQLLLPLGVALTIAAVFFSKNSGMRRLAFSVIIGSALSYNITTYISYFIDWNKQKALVAALARNPKIAKATLVIINDRTKYLNARNRTYAFYEWNGIFEQAYGNQGRFVMEPSYLIAYQSGEYDDFFSAHYKAAGFARNGNVSTLLVDITQHKEEMCVNSCNSMFPQFVLGVQSIDIDTEALLQ